ncbi:LysE/ArgO family amino acid transporter [Fulvimarina sp. 2208YS6-2-32]|uniref:LysE/ArgO family amino acid transporter n=1 Tax=Fulvimarina uroteuthidis TaxID=3098149 RepID=A0ABU5HXN9_9HYPH|nr:LysE/ArgO family amino acid transporter [Fulvimarina sp. 2208YS6-2-32]MDY8107857.1 LysE/ArgO family amino acid transporter [Fulvimarina sp. 2208YS6-2-32]
MTATLSAFAIGFATGFSLILAIGAQNAFVLRQGLRGEHVLPVVLTCALSDAVLIAIGVTSFAAVSKVLPSVEIYMRWFGAAFLVWYGATRLLAAWRGGEGALETGGEVTTSLKAAILSCLAFTFLNPHVYLDTVVLLGSIASQFDGDALVFGVGAVSSSFAFFFSLGYGARLLRPLFVRPAAWRVLDLIVGLTMLAIAAALLSSP